MQSGNIKPVKSSVSTKDPNSFFPDASLTMTNLHINYEGQCKLEGNIGSWIWITDLVMVACALALDIELVLASLK